MAMKRLSYFQKIAPAPAPGGRESAPQLRPAPPLFRPSATPLEFVEIHDTSAAPRSSAASRAGAQVAGPADATVSIKAFGRAAEAASAPVSLSAPGAGLAPKPSAATAPRTAPPVDPGVDRLAPPAPAERLFSNGAAFPGRPDEAVIPAAALRAAAPSVPPAMPVMTPVAPPSRPASTSGAGAGASPRGAPSVHIGTLEVRIAPAAPAPQAAQARPAPRFAPVRAPAPGASLARRPGVFGLGQS